MRRSKEDAMKTREAILQSALECFSKDGYAVTTFVQIGKRIGVTKSCIFWHFDSKEHLLAEVIAQMHGQCEPLKGIENVFTLDELKECFMVWANVIETEPNQKNFLQFMISRVEWSDALRDKLRDLLGQLAAYDPFLRVEKCIERLKMVGEVESPLSSKQIATLLTLTFFGVYRETCLRGVEVDPIDTLDHGLDFVIQGIRSK